MRKTLNVKDEELKGLEIDWDVYEKIAINKGLNEWEARYMRLRLSGVHPDKAEREVGWRSGDGIFFESGERYRKALESMRKLVEEEVRFKLGVYEKWIINELFHTITRSFEDIWSEMEDDIGGKVTDNDMLREYRKMADGWYRHRMMAIRMVLTHAERLRQARRRLYEGGEYIGRRTVLRDEQKATIEQDLVEYGSPRQDDLTWGSKLLQALDQGDPESIQRLTEIDMEIDDGRIGNPLDY